MLEKGSKFLGQFFPSQHFCKKKKPKKNNKKKNWFLFDHIILSYIYFDNFMLLKVSFSTVLFLKQSEK